METKLTFILGDTEEDIFILEAIKAAEEDEGISKEDWLRSVVRDAWEYYEAFDNYDQFTKFEAEAAAMVPAGHVDDLPPEKRKIFDEAEKEAEEFNKDKIHWK